MDVEILAVLISAMLLGMGFLLKRYFFDRRRMGGETPSGGSIPEVGVPQVDSDATQQTTNYYHFNVSGGYLPNPPGTTVPELVDVRDPETEFLDQKETLVSKNGDEPEGVDDWEYPTPKRVSSAYTEIDDVSLLKEEAVSRMYTSSNGEVDIEMRPEGDCGSDDTK